MEVLIVDLTKRLNEVRRGFPRANKVWALMGIWYVNGYVMVPD